MAISVTSNQNTTTQASGGSIVVTLNSTQLTSGSILIAVISWSNTTNTYSVSDPTNGTWGGPFVRSIQGSNSECMLYTVTNSSSAGSLTVTANITSGSAGSMTVFEVTGITNSIDQSATKQNTAATTWTCGPTGTTTSSSELCIFVCRVTSATETWSSFSPYTIIDSTHLSSFTHFVGYNILASTGTQSGSVTGGTLSAASTLIATFPTTAPPLTSSFIAILP